MNLAPTHPRVSVVIPAYQAEAFLKTSIESVLQQQFESFEVLVINDGSTDGTKAIAESYADPRIRLINNTKNLGLAGVRNVGIREARGEYVAWLDADDISRPGRLQKQIHFLDANPGCVLVGSWVRPLRNGVLGKPWKYPTINAVLRCRLLFDDPFATSAVTVRKQVLESNGLSFSENFPPAEDYDLWERLSHLGTIANVPEVLGYYHIHAQQTSTSQEGVVKQQSSVWRIHERQLKNLGLLPTAEQKTLHQKLGAWKYEGTLPFVRDSKAWLIQIWTANEKSGFYEKAALSWVLSERWKGIVGSAANQGFSVWNEFKHSGSQLKMGLGLLFQVRLFIKCLVRKGGRS